jgi:hypothetical protein
MKFRIEVSSGSAIPGRPARGVDCRVYLDGQDISPHCRAVTFNASVGSVVTVQLDLYPGAVEIVGEMPANQMQVTFEPREREP